MQNDPVKEMNSLGLKRVSESISKNIRNATYRVNEDGTHFYGFIISETTFKQVDWRILYERYYWSLCLRSS